MTKLEREIDIAAPRERVFEVLLDPDCLPRLRPPQTVKTSAPRN